MRNLVFVCLSLSLCLYNFPDGRMLEQRDVTFDLDKFMQGEYRCKDQLAFQQFGVAFGQLTPLQEAVFRFRLEFEI